MSLLKSVVITCIVFVFIGLGLWGCYFIEQENKADKNLALVKDLYQKGEYSEVLSKIGDKIPMRKKEEFMFVKLEALMELGRLYESEDLANEIIKINPKNDKCYYLLGLALYNNNDLQKSIQSFEKAVELQPKNIDYKLNLARLLVINGDKDKAIKVYRQIMKQDPRYEVAWAEVAEIYNTKGNKKEVLNLRRDAAKRFPNNAYDQHMLGVICNELNLKQEAIVALRKSLALQPDADTNAKELLQKLTGKRYDNLNSKQEKIPLHGLNNLLIADAKVNNINGKFLIDTGASSSVLYERFIKKNKIKINSNSYGVLEMANGNKSYAPSSYVTLKLGRNILADTKVYILPDSKSLNLDGIIGMDLLNNYSITFDKNYENLVISR